MRFIEWLDHEYGIVTYAEAVNAWADGKDISCYLKSSRSNIYTFMGKEPTMREKYSRMEVTKEMIKEGAWYIEPKEGER